MKYAVTKFVLLFLILAGVSCTSDENCVWKYKCCEFKETNGEVSCVKMCEPEINCQGSNNEEVEMFDENAAEGEYPGAPLSIRSRGCKRGFQYYDGRCRRVFGRTRERLQESV